MRLYKTSFHDKGRAEGRVEGLEEGLELAKRDSVQRLVSKRFGDEVYVAFSTQFDALSAQEIDDFFDAAIFFMDSVEITSWFEAYRNKNKIAA